MSVAGYGHLEFFLNMPVKELMETVKEVSRIAKEQRVRVSNKNRRRS